MLDARGVGRKALIAAKFGCTKQLAERGELAVRANRQNELALPRAQELIRSDARVAVAHPVRHHAAGRKGGALVGQRREQRVANRPFV